MKFTRRNLLKATAVSCATPSMNLWAAEEPKPRKLKLGLVTYNWGKSWDVPTIIANCQTTGFTGVELRSTHKHGVEITMDASRREEVRQRFQNSNVELVGLGSACEFHSADPQIVAKNIAETKQFVRLCSDVGGTGVKVRPNGLPNDVPVEKTLEQIGKSLRTVGQYAAEFDVQIRVEVHGRGTSQIPHMKTIMDIADHPQVVVCWNCNPTDLAGQGLQHNYRSLEDRMGTIHIHDLRTENYPWGDLFPLLKSTHSASFTGWTLLEEGSVPDDIVGAMRENHARWHALAT